MSVSDQKIPETEENESRKSNGNDCSSNVKQSVPCKGIDYSSSLDLAEDCDHSKKGNVISKEKYGKVRMELSDETSSDFRNVSKNGDTDFVSDIGSTVDPTNVEENKVFISNKGHSAVRSDKVTFVPNKQGVESSSGSFGPDSDISLKQINHVEKISDPGYQGSTRLTDSTRIFENQEMQDNKSEEVSLSESQEGDTRTLTEVSLPGSEDSDCDINPENTAKNINSELDSELNSNDTSGERFDRWSYPRVNSKDGTFSDSPTSDFEFSASSSLTSCTEDSGISSTVRDDDLEEIPLHDRSLNSDKPAIKKEADFLKQISALSVNDHLPPSWMPKTLNTYAPAHPVDDMNDGIMNGTSEPKKQSKFKGLFSRSGSQKSPNQLNQGWKLFGRLPPKSNEGPLQQTNTLQQEPENKTKPLTSFSRDDVVRRSFGEQTSKSKNKVLSLKRNTPAVASSTTALIFENRPRNLPAKSPTEEKRHRQMYEAMIAEAKKKELKDLKQQKKKEKEKCKQEEGIVSAVTIWSSEILPNWDTMCTSKKAREMWWQGLPPSVRGKIWRLAIGNDLHITHELFDIFQAHAYEKLLVTRRNKKKQKEQLQSEDRPATPPPAVSKEHTVELIMLDVSRTFPSLCIFQKGGPYHDILHSILGAYTCYRPDVGYVQGMSFIAAVLLLNMDPSDAFICFANILNKPCQLAFFRVDHSMMKAYFATFDIFLEEHLPKLHEHFKHENFSPDMYLIDWIFTLYSKSLPLDVACRVWDVFCRDGDVFLFSTALGILTFYQSELLGMDFIHLGQFLNKLPEDIPANPLFNTIAVSSISKHNFNQILAQQKEIVTQIKTLSSASAEKTRV